MNDSLELNKIHRRNESKVNIMKVENRIKSFSEFVLNSQDSRHFEVDINLETDVVDSDDELGSDGADEIEKNDVMRLVIDFGNLKAVEEKLSAIVECVDSKKSFINQLEAWIDSMENNEIYEIEVSS